MYHRENLVQVIHESEPSFSQRGMPKQASLVMVGLPTVSIALAWGLVTSAPLPAASYVGLGLVLIALATMLMVAGKRAGQNVDRPRQKD